MGPPNQTSDGLPVDNENRDESKEDSKAPDDEDEVPPNLNSARQVCAGDGLQSIQGMESSNLAESQGRSKDIPTDQAEVAGSKGDASVNRDEVEGEDGGIPWLRKKNVTFESPVSRWRESNDSRNQEPEEEPYSNHEPEDEHNDNNRGKTMEEGRDAPVDSNEGPHVPRKQEENGDHEDDYSEDEYSADDF